MGKLKTYKVYFTQVNQMVYEVQAATKESAETKASTQWTKDHKYPTASYIEVKD